MTTKKSEKSDAMRFLNALSGGSLTLAQLLLAIREGENLSQNSFALQLGISRSHLCDIEKGRKFISPARAAEFAATLGYSSQQFVRLALQEQLDKANLEFKVELAAA